MKELEARMRRGEWFHPLTVPAGMWTVVRVDGRAFTRFTEMVGYDKPFDVNFAGAMWATARDLMTEFGGLYAYVESDEISLLLPREFNLFDREVEKVVSLTAATASVAFLRAAAPQFGGLTGFPLPTFDSRIWLGATDDDVLDYFAWRMSDAFRCGLNGWTYWTLRRNGATAAQATRTLLGTSVPAKNEILHEHGININDVPSWHRRGAGLWFEPYTKIGHNPITGQDVPAVRRRVRVDTDLPRSGYAYRQLLRAVMTEGDLPPVRADLLKALERESQEVSP